MHKCYNYTKIKKGEPNLEKLKNCLDKWGHYRDHVGAIQDYFIASMKFIKEIIGNNEDINF